MKVQVPAARIARVIDHFGRPHRGRGYPFHLLEVEETFSLEGNSRWALLRAEAAARQAIHRYTHSVAGAGRRFSGHREGGRVVFTRIA